jgi:hypothetical protein
MAVAAALVEVTESEESAVVPTAPPKLTVPAPELTVRLWPPTDCPSTVPEKVMFPPLVETEEFAVTVVASATERVGVPPPVF